MIIFERNFCLSKDELPNDEILTLVRVYQEGSAADYYQMSNEGIDPDIIGKIVNASRDGRIPTIAINAIFLKPRKGKALLQKAIMNYMDSNVWPALPKAQLEIVAEDLYQDLYESCEIEKSVKKRLMGNLIINIHNKDKRDLSEKDRIKEIGKNRKVAVKEMDRLISKDNEKFVFQKNRMIWL